MAVMFISQHLGAANFVCIGGSFHGNHVSVRYLNRQWHLDARIRGQFAHLSDEQFANHVLTSIGIVHCAGRPVPAGIICAVNAHLSYDMSRSKNVVTEVFTGMQNLQGAFRRLSLVELERLFPVFDPEDEADFPEDLAADTVRLSKSTALTVL
jgi:hypothetical protein